MKITKPKKEIRIKGVRRVDSGDDEFAPAELIPKFIVELLGGIIVVEKGLG